MKRHDSRLTRPNKVLRNHRIQKRHRVEPVRMVESRRGAATVELALVTPFLLAVALGICELGQAYKVDAILSAASRAASMTGARPGCSNTDVIYDAKAVLIANGISTDSLTMKIMVNDQQGEVATAVHNDKITVTASIPTSRVVVVNTLTFLGVDSVLSQSTTMLRQ